MQPVYPQNEQLQVTGFEQSGDLWLSGFACNGEL
jgi:hypothetical protein